MGGGAEARRKSEEAALLRLRAASLAGQIGRRVMQVEGLASMLARRGPPGILRVKPVGETEVSARVQRRCEAIGLSNSGWAKLVLQLWLERARGQRDARAAARLVSELKG